VLAVGQPSNERLYPAVVARVLKYILRAPSEVLFLFYENIIEIIKNYQEKGSRYGLKSTRDLLNALGSPDDYLKIIHVAGTNGKGSTCEYLTQILASAGKKVGTFTSPEVYDYSEKFKVNGKCLNEEKLKKYLSVAYQKSLEFEVKPTAFEVETCAALYAFYMEGCEYCVLECGLGGLTDSTNAINKKKVAVILSIGLEHTALLGNSIGDICQQKAGIIKNCPAIVSSLQCEEAVKFFNNKGVIFADGVKILSSNLHGQSFACNGEEYKINMLGTAQAYNAATAIKVARHLKIDNHFIKEGLLKAKLLGRVEVINKTHATYILDGSHNPDSFLPLCEILDGIKQEDKLLIFGCLSDKDANAAAAVLSKSVKSVVAISPPSYRAMEIQKIISALQAHFASVSTSNGIKEAITDAKAKIVVVCGSFTVLKEAKKWIEKEQ